MLTVVVTVVVVTVVVVVVALNGLVTSNLVCLTPYANYSKSC